MMNAGQVRAGVVLLLGVSAMAGCVRQHETEDERLRRETADSTRELRHDAQNAGIEARKAADQARRQAQDIVAGVRQGWKDGAPPKDSAGRLDLNTATVAQLASVRGITEETAKRIVHHRPYASTSDLVKRGVVTEAEYNKFSDRVSAQ